VWLAVAGAILLAALAPQEQLLAAEQNPVSQALVIKPKLTTNAIAVRAVQAHQDKVKLRLEKRKLTLPPSPARVPVLKKSPVAAR
jgi:hypothetical protein